MTIKKICRFCKNNEIKGGGGKSRTELRRLVVKETTK